MELSEQGQCLKELSGVATQPSPLATLRKTVQESLEEVKEATIAETEGGEGATTVEVEVENIMDAVNAMLAKTIKWPKG